MPETQTYTVTVTDHVNDEVHTAGEDFADIHTAKNEVEWMLRGIYQDSPQDVMDAVDDLTSRIFQQRGVINTHDAFLDCTVQIAVE